MENLNFIDLCLIFYRLDKKLDDFLCSVFTAGNACPFRADFRGVPMVIGSRVFPQWGWGYIEVIFSACSPRNAEGLWGNGDSVAYGFRFDLTDR